MAETMGTTHLQTLPYLRKRWKRVGRKLTFSCTTRAEWRAWRRKLLRKLRELTGYDTMVRAPLRPKVTGVEEADGYTRQRVEIQTEPGVIMSLFVLIPHGGDAPYPAMVAAHGHSSGGKRAVVGDRSDPELAAVIDEHNYDYGVQLVREGFIVFCPDARGFGERREAGLEKGFRVSSCARLNHMAFSLGQTVTGMWAWDIHRLIDYIQTRPDTDPTRIGCAGLSGGGLQTLWATALDTRIRCAVISGYFYGSKESLLDMQCCWCNYVPHLYECADMGDIAALIAPRPLLVETGTEDTLNGASGVKNVRAQMRIVRKAYHLLDAGRMLKHDIYEGGHMWHGVEANPWLKRHLCASTNG
jgi:dienelactone hydrolase